MVKARPADKLESLVGTDADKAILEAAAKLIVESGTKEIDVSKLAQRAGVTRPTVYARYSRGRKESVGTVIYLRILNQFLRSAGDSIRAALAVVDQRSHAASTPGEQLAAILRATLSAFKHEPLFGSVVLQELSLRNSEENELIRPIFNSVDKIIHDAQTNGHISKVPKDAWKIRQVFFVLTRGLLRTLYLDQYDKADKLMETSAMTEKEVEIEILKVLSLYSQDQSEANVQETIKLLDKKDGKRSDNKSDT